jgi:hypothetical protein
VTQARMTIFRPFVILECVHFMDAVMYVQGYLGVTSVTSESSKHV